MKIVNAAGPQLPGLVVGLAKQKTAALARSIKTRPYKKTLAYTTDATQDIYLIIIQLGVSSGGDSAIIVNANEFRLVSAINEVLGDGSIYPIVTWKGGVPPFQIELVYNNPALGGFMDSDTTGMVVNINPNLTDGVGDIVTAGMAREYIITKVDDADGWWADDLQTADLGFDEIVNIQKRQNAIGLQITDSATPARSLFAPFSPDPVYEADGISPSGLFSKYPEGRFGPPTWCVPIIHWDQPAAIVYGTPLQVGMQLDALTHIPATTIDLPGDYSYWLDTDHSVPAEEAVPDANIRLPLYVTFQAQDSLHYHLAEAEQNIVVNKAEQQIVIVRDTVTMTGRVGDIGNVVAETRSLYLFVLSPTGLPVTLGSSNTSIISISGDVNNSVLGATVTFVGAGKANVYLSQPGGDNHKAAPTIIGGTHNISFAMNTPGGVTFDINDSPITYGEALDVLCWSPIAGNPSYQTAGEPAGWVVDPVPGVYLETNSDGSPHEYSITALFYPSDTVNYPSVMEYEQLLTVGKNIPVVIWNPTVSFIYGMHWLAIMNAICRNSHHSSDPAWGVEGGSVYTVSGHGNPTFNGIIIDSSVMPDADTGFFVSCQFTPFGTNAHNYAQPAPLDEGFEITQKALTITANNASKIYNGSAWAGGNGVTYSGFVQGQDQSVLSGSLSFTGSAQGAVNAGTYTNGIVPSGVTSNNYAISFVPGSLTVSKAASVITWADPAAITYGTALSATQLNATANVPGTFSYDPPADTILSVGNHALAVIFTPTDSGNYNGDADGVWLTVGKDAQAINNIAAYHNTKSVIYWGSELSHVTIWPGETATVSAFIASSPNSGNLIQFSSSSEACSVGPSSMISQLHHKATLTFNQPGDFYVTASLQGDNLFEAASPIDSAVFTITKATATVNSANASNVYTGSPITAAGTTTPTGLSVSYTYNGSATPPTNAGVYTVVGTVNDANYSGSGSWTLTITKASQTISALSVTGAIITDAGGGIGTVTPVNSSAGLAVVYTASAGVDVAGNLLSCLVAGTYIIYGDQPGNGNYFAAPQVSTTITVIVLKTNPVITWADPAAITYGTALSATQLNATANVPGTFVYSPAAGTVPNANTGLELSVTFTPSDTTLYNVVQDWAGIVVNKATHPAMTLSFANIVVGGAGWVNIAGTIAGDFMTSWGTWSESVAGTITISNNPLPGLTFMVTGAKVGTFSVYAQIENPNYETVTLVSATYAVSAKAARATGSLTVVSTSITVGSQTLVFYPTALTGDVYEQKYIASGTTGAASVSAVGPGNRNDFYVNGLAVGNAVPQMYISNPAYEDIFPVGPSITITADAKLNHVVSAAFTNTGYKQPFDVSYLNVGSSTTAANNIVVSSSNPAVMTVEKYSATHYRLFCVAQGTAYINFNVIEASGSAYNSYYNSQVMYVAAPGQVILFPGGNCSLGFGSLSYLDNNYTNYIGTIRHTWNGYAVTWGWNTSATNTGHEPWIVAGFMNITVQDFVNIFVQGHLYSTPLSEIEANVHIYRFEVL